MSTLLLSALGVVCPACDHHNPPRSPQCVACGASFQPKAAPAVGPPRQTPPAIPVPSPALTPRPGSSVPPGMKPAAAAPVIAKPAATPLAPPAPMPGPGAQPIPASELVKRQVTRPSAAPSAPAPAPAPQAGPATVSTAPRFGLAVLSGPSQGQRYRLSAAGAQLGRARGAILFPDDPGVSAHHATFMVRDAKLFVRDEGSASGVLVSITGQQAIPPNTYFSAGLRLFRYAGAVAAASPPAPGRPMPYGSPVAPGQPVYLVEEILVGGRPGRAITTSGPVFAIGHTKCDFAFPPEEGLAARHCELAPSPAGAVLKDLSGGMGTFVRIPPGADRALASGDRLRIGQQVLQIEALA